jgi:hypothetical protein
MPKKETLSQFMKNFDRMDEGIQRESMAKWNVNTLLTMSKAQEFAIVDKGDLQGSARAVKAVIGPRGFESAFIFGVPYAVNIETGKRRLKSGKVIELKQRSFDNPKGGFGYAGKAVDSMSDKFITDLKNTVSKVWNRI